MFNKKEAEVQMLPKDLLVDLEKGDRTKEFMATDVMETERLDATDLNPALNNFQWRAQAAQGIQQQQVLLTSTSANTGVYINPFQRTSGGWL